MGLLYIISCLAAADDTRVQAGNVDVAGRHGSVLHVLA